MGKPYQLLNPSIRKGILDGLRRGMSRAAAASAAGIHPETLRRWVRTGEKENAEEPYASFYLEYCAALAGLQGELVDVVAEEARKGDWKAAMTLLERRFREDFSRTVNHKDEREPTKVIVNFGKDAHETEDDDE